MVTWPVLFIDLVPLWSLKLFRSPMNAGGSWGFDSESWHKSKVFHFICSHKYDNPPLDLTSVSGPVLTPKPVWHYLGFFFDRKLSFRYHCHYYATKSLSTVKAMKLLGNSSRGLPLLHKHLLYCTCILPIALYGFQLWYYKNTPLKYHIHKLSKLQWQATLWITGAFKTSSLEEIEGIADLIPIFLYLCKLAGWSHLRYSAIPLNNAISSLLEQLAPPSTNMLSQISH